MKMTEKYGKDLHAVQNLLNPAQESVHLKHAQQT